MTDAAEPTPMDHVRPEPAPRTDLVTGGVILAFGLAVIRMAWAMPTFTDRGGDPFTAPGIVPGFYGLVLALLGTVLAARSVLRGALRPGGGASGGVAAFAHSRVSRLVAAVVVCFGYAIGLIGTLPFWLATSTFVTAFVLLFEWQDETAARRLRRIAMALALGLATGVTVTLVFERLFLVRLP